MHKMHKQRSPHPRSRSSRARSNRIEEMLYPGIQAQTLRTKRDLANELTSMIHSQENLLASHPELKVMLMKAIHALDAWGEEEQLALNNLGRETTYAALCEKPTTATGAQNILRESSFCQELKAISKTIKSYYGNGDKGQRAWSKFVQPILSVLTLQNLARVGLGVGVIGAGALAHRYLRSPGKTLGGANEAVTHEAPIHEAAHETATHKAADGVAPYEAILMQHIMSNAPHNESQKHKAESSAVFKNKNPWYKKNWFRRNRNVSMPEEEQEYQPRYPSARNRRNSS